MNRSLRTTTSILLATLVVGAGPFASQAALAKGGGGTTPPATTGGGGGSNAVALPADFPSSVPLPVGKLSSATSWSAGGVTSQWGVIVIVDGSLADAVAKVQATYAAAGFTQADPNEFSVYHYGNGSWDVTFLGAARDHSNTQTNVTILVAPH